MRSASIWGCLVHEWIQESGDVDRDAAYVLALPSLELRRRELARLGRVHGDGYRWNVERAVKGNWPEMAKKLPPLPIERHADPRQAAKDAARAARRWHARSLF